MRPAGGAGEGGGLGQQGHVHNGTEQAFTRKLVDYLRGGAPDGSGLSFKGGTGNHLALSRTYAYAYSAPLGRPLLREFLDAQEKQGHLSYGGRNEINTSSHAAWHIMWAAAAWLIALRRQDAAVLAPIRRWWRAELALERLGADADGNVELPGARDYHGDADQRKQRNVGRAIILGLKGKVARVPKTAGTPEGGPLSTDMAGVWALTVIRKEFPGEFVSQMANIGNPDLPLLRDTMYVLSTKDQSTIWFETISDAIDCCWWVHRRPGVLAYGIDPARRSGAPGGPRPASVPEPPGVEGEGPVRIEVKGKGVRG